MALGGASAVLGQAAGDATATGGLIRLSFGAVMCVVEDEGRMQWAPAIFVGGSDDANEQTGGGR